MPPGALNEAQSLERQYEGTEQQIGYAKAVKISKDRVSRSKREREGEREGKANTYLMIKAAATLRTLGHLSSATTVRKLPQMPTIMIRKVMIAAKVNSDCEKLKASRNQKLRLLFLSRSIGDR